MIEQFETYSDRKVTLELGADGDFLLEVEYTGTVDTGKTAFAYLSQRTLVETLNKFPGIKVEIDETYGLPKTEDSIVKRYGKSFVRAEKRSPGDEHVWVRVSDGARFSDRDIAKDGNFEVVFDAGVK